MANEAFHEKMSLENQIGEIYNTWLLKVDGHHLKSGIPHDQRVIVWGIDSWSFGVCSHNVLISQRQNIYREKGKPSVVHPLSSSSSTVFLVECRFLRRGQNRSTGKKILSEQRRESATNSTVLAHKESVIKWKSSVSWVEPCVYVALRWFIFQCIRLVSILWYSNPHAYLTVLAFLVYEVGTPPCCTHIQTKSCAPPLPLLIFLLLTCQLEKTNVELGGRNRSSLISPRIRHEVVLL